MKITPEAFQNGGEVDCCVRAKGRLSIRVSPFFKGERQYEAYCHEFTPGSRESKDVVHKRGTLAEVVAYTNEKCGLEDTVETPSGDEAIPLANTIYADEDLRSSMAEEPADKPEPIDAADTPKLTEAKLAEERMSRTWW